MSVDVPKNLVVVPWGWENASPNKFTHKFGCQAGASSDDVGCTEEGYVSCEVCAFKDAIVLKGVLNGKIPFTIAKKGYRYE